MPRIAAAARSPPKKRPSPTRRGAARIPAAAAARRAHLSRSASASSATSVAAAAAFANVAVPDSPDSDSTTDSPITIDLINASGALASAAAASSSSINLPRTKEGVDPRPDARQNEVGDVFVIGSGDCGQLGLGPDVLEKERPCRVNYFNDKNIVAVYAGGLHNLALSRSGRLYSWGCNDQRALGRGGEETEPAPVEVEGNPVFVSAVCGDSISAALTVRGDVYIWGTFRNMNGVFGASPTTLIQDRPALVRELKNINNLSCGSNHLIAVSNTGIVYTFGVGEQGQLGRRTSSRRVTESSLTAQPINFRSGSRGSKCYRTAFCCGYSTFMVSIKHDVFSFGLNNYGQLGLGDLAEHDRPERVLLEMDENDESGAKAVVQQIVGGEHHTVILDDTGVVHVCGRGDSGQLGLKSKPEHQDSPARITDFDNVVSVAANGAFTLAVRRNKRGTNDLYAWGYGEMGQLGNGSMDVMTPELVDLRGRHVLGAAAGGQHTILLLRFKDL